MKSASQIRITNIFPPRMQSLSATTQNRRRVVLALVFKDVVLTCGVTCLELQVPRSFLLDQPQFMEGNIWKRSRFTFTIPNENHRRGPCCGSTIRCLDSIYEHRILVLSEQPHFMEDTWNACYMLVTASGYACLSTI